jgi:hypothetical protein
MLQEHRIGVYSMAMKLTFWCLMPPIAFWWLCILTLPRMHDPNRVGPLSILCIFWFCVALVPVAVHWFRRMYRRVVHDFRPDRQR